MTLTIVRNYCHLKDSNYRLVRSRVHIKPMSEIKRITTNFLTTRIHKAGFFLILLVTSCSGLKLSYSQLDWFIPAYIDQHISLEDEQYRLIENRIEALLSWHCSTQLARYSSWLNSIADDMKNDRLQLDRIRQHQQVLVSFWSELKVTVYPDLFKLIGTITDQQLIELKEAFDDKNEDLKQDYVDQRRDEVLELLIERMEERIERWVDDLEPAQKEIIKRWGAKVVGDQHLWLKQREIWQSLFLDVMKNNKENPEELKVQLKDLFLNPEQFWTEDYRRHVERYRLSQLVLLRDLIQTITKDQREYFLEKVSSYSNDFRDLTCLAANNSQ